MTNTVDEVQIDDFLAHYGVKGMKWGVRKPEDSGGDGRAKSAAGQPKWGSHVDVVTKNELKAYNRAVESLNKTGLATLNTNPKYAGKKINPNSALGRKYQKDAQALFDRTMANKLRNANIRKQLTRTAVTAISLYLGVGLIGSGVNVALMIKDLAGRGAANLDALQHAADLALPPRAYKFKLNLNELGQIESIGELKEVDVPTELKHVDDVDEFLAHYGVKGMKWGVRKRDNANLRDSVRAGTATLGEAHLAGMKSTGHRVTNAVLGDKHYWTKQVPTLAAIGAVGTGLSLGLPEILPESFLSDLTARAYDMNSFETAVRGTVNNHGMVEAGKGLARAAGLTATVIGANIYGYYAQGSNLGRAIIGNRSLRKNYEALGDAALKAQTAGNKRTQRILNRRGSIAKRDLRHADGELTFGQIYELMPESTRDLFDTIVGAGLSDTDISGEADLVAGYDALSDTHKALIDFIVGGELNSSVRHDDTIVDEFLAHYGVKGMKWGVRRARDAVSSARAKRSAKKASSVSEDSDESSSSSSGTQTDAQKVAAIRAKAAKDGLDSLSNAEMQALVTRMNLTQQYNKVTKTPSRQEQVRKMIDKQVKNGKTLNDVMAFYNSPAGQLINAMVRSPKAGKHVKIAEGTHIKDLAAAVKKK